MTAGDALAAEDGKSRGSMNKARQVTPVMVRRIAWPALNRDSKQGRPVDSHCRLSFALPPQLSSVFTPASDQMPFSQNFWAYRQNAVVMLPSAALPPEPGKLPLMLQKAKPVQPAPKQRCSAWHCSCSGIPTVLFSSQGPCEDLRFWSSLPLPHMGFALTGAELVFAKRSGKVCSSPHLCHGKFCPAAGSASAQSHWGDTGHGCAGEDAPQPTADGQRGCLPIRLCQFSCPSSGLPVCNKSMLLHRR